MSTLLLIVTCFLTFLTQSVFCGFFGPAEINIKSIELCDNPEDYKYTINVKRHKINRTHEAFDANANFGIPLDEDTGIHVNLAKKSFDGNYRPTAFKFREKNACTFFMKWIGDAFKELLIKIGQPPECPLAPGNYEFKNYLINFRDIPVSFEYGDFRADIFLVRDDDDVVCMKTFLETKPKTS